MIRAAHSNGQEVEATTGLLHRLTGPGSLLLPELSAEAQLGILLSGEAVCTVRSCSHYLRGSDVLFTPASCRCTRIELMADSQMVFLSFCKESLISRLEQLDTLRIQRMLQSMEVEDSIFRTRLEGDTLSDAVILLECICHAQRGRQAARFSTVLADALYSLLSLLLGAEESENACCSSRNAQIMDSCLNYIDSNYHHPLSTLDMAQYCAMSEASFRSLFAKRTGMSLKKYLTEKRIAQACALLRDAEYPLQMIANLVGYQDTSTFYRNFTKLQGVTPAQYRIRCQAGAGAFQVISSQITQYQEA